MIPPVTGPSTPPPPGPGAPYIWFAFRYRHIHVSHFCSPQCTLSRHPSSIHCWMLQGSPASTLIPTMWRSRARSWQSSSRRWQRMSSTGWTCPPSLWSVSLRSRLFICPHLPHLPAAILTLPVQLVGSLLCACTFEAVWGSCS